MSPSEDTKDFSCVFFPVLHFTQPTQMALRWLSWVDSVRWSQARGAANSFHHIVAFRGCTYGTLRWISSKGKQETVEIVPWKYLWTGKKSVWVSCLCFGHKNHIPGVAEKWWKSQLERKLLRLEQKHIILYILSWQKIKGIKIFHKNWKNLKFIWQWSFDW